MDDIESLFLTVTCRGGRLCPPSKFVDFSWSFVGVDAHIGPLECCEFALDFRKTEQFRRADRVVRPYGAKWEIKTDLPENRHKAGASCGSMWASTPTARNGKLKPIRRKPIIKRALPAGRCGHRPLRGEKQNTLRFIMAPCRGGRPCPPSKIVQFCEVVCRGRCLHRPFKMLRIRIGFP